MIRLWLGYKRICPKTQALKWGHRLRRQFQRLIILPVSFQIGTESARVYIRNVRVLIIIFTKYLKMSITSPAAKRLIKDLQKIQKEEGGGINATPMEDNIFKWQALIEGPEKTPWEGGLFELKLQFTQQYPNKAPNVVFVSEMFHPNIYNDGRICLDILGNQWSPVYDVWAILTSIRSLLCDPNPLSPANSQAAQMFQQNKGQYERRVKQVVDKSLKE